MRICFYHGGRWCVQYERSDGRYRSLHDPETCRLHLETNIKTRGDSSVSFRVRQVMTLRLVFTWRRQQVVDVDGLRAVGSSEKLLLQPLPQGRVGLDAPLQLQPQVSDL